MDAAGQDPEREPRRVAAVAVAFPAGAIPDGQRGRVLRAALGLYAERGFHGTSIRDIAAAAGTNSATLYAHYPSKEHLLADLVLIGHSELYDRLRAARDSADGPAAQLAALVRSQVLAHTDFPLLAVVINDEMHALSAELAAPALELRTLSAGLAADVIDQGARDGVFQVTEPLLAARAISAMGLRVGYWFSPAAPHTREQVADCYVEFALRVVGAECQPVTP